MSTPEERGTWRRLAERRERAGRHAVEPGRKLHTKDISGAIVADTNEKDTTNMDTKLTPEKLDAIERDAKMKAHIERTFEGFARQIAESMKPSPSTLAALRADKLGARSLSDRYASLRQADKASGSFVSSEPEEIVSKREFVDGIRRRTNVTTGPLGPWTNIGESRDVPAPGGVVASLVDVVPTENAILQVGENVDPGNAVAVATAYGSSAQQTNMQYGAETPVFDWLPVFAAVARDVWEAPFARQKVLRQLVEVELGSALDATVLTELAGASLPTQALSTDDRVTAIVKAAAKVRKAKFGQTGTTVLLAPDDATALAGDVDAATETKLRLAGVTGFATSTLVTPGAPVVGDFLAGASLFVSQGVSVETSNSHGSFLIQGLIAVIASTRVVARCHFPHAFCSVTGF